MRIRLYRESDANGIMPLARLATGQLIYPAQGGDGSADPDDDDGDETDEEEEDEEVEDKDKKTEGDDSGDTGDTADEGKKALEAKLVKFRERMKAADRRAGLAEKRLADLEGKDKPELDKVKAELQELREKNGLAEESLNAARLENAVLKDVQFQWNDPEDVVEMARRALRKGDLEIDEDGDVDGLQDWLKDLAKRKPHYVKVKEGRKRKAADDDDNDDDQPTGSGVGSGRKKKDKLDAAALQGKFPALRA
jgi:hypothetical protein